MKALQRARFARPALIAIIAVDLVALAAFSVRVETVTRTTTRPAPVAATSQPVAPPAAPVVPVAAVAATVPVGTSATSSGTTATEPVTPPSTSPAAPADPGTPDGSARVARCPLAIKEPTTSGGLQSLIGFAPAFGPFKAEAFAAASAYQPVLQLIGPILAKYPELAPQLDPVLAPFLGAFASLLDQGFTLISPLYSPHREQVLEAEGKLATALAPITQQLITSPLGGCVVELQAALLEDTAPTAAAG